MNTTTATTAEQVPATTGEAEPWINSSAACKHLGISTPTLWRWINAGTLPARRTPTGELRFRRSELDALIS